MSHPLVKWLFEEIALQRQSDPSLSERALMRRAGLPRETFQFWKKGTTPRLDTFEAALNVLGYKLEIVEQ